MKPDFDFVSYEQFVKQYMTLSDDSLLAQNSLLQIHPLSTTASLVKVPTPLFRAEYNFLLFFSNGGAVQQVDNDIIELKPNDVLFIREGHLNAVKTIHPNSKGYFIYLDSSILPQVFTESTRLSNFTFNPKRRVSHLDMEWMCGCLDLMTQVDDTNKAAVEIQTTLLKAVIMKLANGSTTTSAKLNRKTEISMMFKELVYTHFKEKREVGFYAKLLSVTENYLSRCLKEITNKPPKQHINEVAISYSQMLLQDFSKDISQVAFELGFYDQSYFCRLFKQITKQTPSNYRNSISQDLSK